MNNEIFEAIKQHGLFGLLIGIATSSLSVMGIYTSGNKVTRRIVLENIGNVIWAAIFAVIIGLLFDHLAEKQHALYSPALQHATIGMICAVNKSIRILLSKLFMTIISDPIGFIVKIKEAIKK